MAASESFPMDSPALFPSRDRVLLVEDSRLFGAMLARRIEQETGAEVVWVRTYETCLALLDADASGFAVALLDLTLPDAPHGEIIDLVLSRSIPGIVFTGRMNEALREKFWAKRIVDYILKQADCGIDLAVRQVRRIIANKNLQCLVVDDSRLYRKNIVNLLKAHGYQILEAATGREALALLEANPNVKLILADYAMPEMDGVELTREIRRKYRIDEQAIIGLSHAGERDTSVLFLKNGANDYIPKPFQVEEFYCRVSLNIDMLNQFAQIKELAYTDPLTRAANRRALFDAGAAAVATARENGAPVTVAMLDIDHFKRVNDQYGHEAGDEVLRHFAATLRGFFPQPEHRIGRIGGEEFCVVSEGHAAAALLPAYEALRAAVAQATVATRGGPVGYTVSIGVSDACQETFEDMLKIADTLLYRAKACGRDRIAAQVTPQEAGGTA